ncbi:MAG: hypothetical protein P8X39_07330, partial [Desulfofustis sp.]
YHVLSRASTGFSLKPTPQEKPPYLESFDDSHTDCNHSNADAGRDRSAWLNGSIKQIENNMKGNYGAAVYNSPIG